MRKGKSELSDMMPFDANDNETADFDGKNFKLSIHLSGGVFKRKCKPFQYLLISESMNEYT